MGTRISRIIAVLLMAVGVAGVPNGAHADAGGALLGAPAVGSCFLANGAALDADSLTSPARSCRKRHTLRTYAVAAVPDGVDLTLGAANPAVAQQTTEVCTAALGSVIGTNERARGLSAYTWFWFLPTADQQRQGARWISCQLAISAGPGRVSVNRDAKPPKARTHPVDRLRRCVTKAFGVTNCAARHSYRSTYAQAFTSPRDFADQTALSICERKLKGRKWVYEWTLIQGDRRVATCSVRNRH